MSWSPALIVCLSEMRRIVSTTGIVTILLLVGVASAVSTAGGPGAVSQTSTPACSEPPSQVGWYGLDRSESPAVPTIGTTFWDADMVTIGFETTAPTVGFFVVTDGTGDRLGVEYVADREAGHTDGLPIELAENLSGVQTVQVDWHCDANGNGEYDPEVDYAAGPRAGPTSIDFEATVTTPMTTMVTADAGRTSTEPTNGASTPGQPGFTILSSLLAAVVIVLLSRRP